MTSEYLVGRTAALLDRSQTEYVDAVFQAGRYESTTFTELQVEHSTFANCSFKGSTFENCVFINVVFLGSYFRDTILNGCRFEGCKFINCDMSRVDIRSCALKYYNVFSSTTVPFDRISESLPAEGNLRQLLCDNLAREAASIGEFADVGKFRAASMSGQISFLKAVVTRPSPYYRAKYDTTDQIRAAVQLAKVTLFNAIWGSTRSHWVVLRNWVALAVVAFGVLALAGHDSVGTNSTWTRAGFYGSLSTIPIPPPHEYTVDDVSIQILLVGFRFLGLILGATFAALLFARAYEGRR